MAEIDFNPFASEDITPAISEEWTSKRKISAALKELTELLVTTTAPVKVLNSVASSLENIAEQLDEHPKMYGRRSFADASEHGNYGQIMHETNPLGGHGNPMAPPINMWFEDGIALGTAEMGWQYEGPPGSVHGGFVAAVFDQFMGMAQIIGKQPGMTGTLSVRYIKPTPLNVKLRLKAWLERVEGRKTVIHAEMRAGDTLTASCEALFVRPHGGIHAPPAGQKDT